jgi:uncharacterized protein (TIGR03118 family)
MNALLLRQAFQGSRFRRLPSRRSTVEPLESRALLSGNYLQFALSADQSGQALIQDQNLVNPWGMGLNANGGELSISDTATGRNTFYAGDVAHSPLTQDPLIVSVPGGSPTGQIFNGTTDFTINANGPATFLIAGATGNVSGWNAGTTAQLGASVVNADFSGLAGALGTQNELYATDFRNSAIDVFDPNFNRVIPSGTFSDPSVPTTMAPFNIVNINGLLYVTYAPANNTAGSGALAVFDNNGKLVSNMPAAAETHLNVPWGLAIAPGNFGSFSNDLLVANAGSGQIDAFNPQTLNFVGVLSDTNGNPFTIDGLKAIAFGNGLSVGNADTLFFTAGPNNHSHGLLGAIESADNNPLDMVGDEFFFVAGSKFSGAVATFAEANLSDSAGTFSASVNWGDGTSSVGSVTSLGAGRFLVDASHVYTSTGTFNATVKVTDAHGHSASVTSVAHSTVASSGSLALTGINTTASQGRAFSGAVATLTDGDGNTSAAAYSATIVWGDGATTSGTVTATGSSFGIAGTHTYAQTGTFPLSIAVTDNDGDSATAAATATVVANPLTAHAINFSATAGSIFSGLVATVKDTDGNTSASAYQATIDWGDGVTTFGTVGAAGSVFDVTGTHTYAFAGSFPVTVAISDSDGDAVTATATATVVSTSSGGTLTASGVNSTDTQGVAFSGLVATISDGDGNTSAAAYTATVNWGDGVTTFGTVSAAGATFDVTGTHTYADSGSFTITVAVTDSDGTSATATATATVAVSNANALVAQGVSSSDPEGRPFNVLVATFSDGDGNTSATAYAATINWGDGVSSSGTITPAGASFDVTGTHTYAQPGSFTITAVITDTDGSSATTTSTATVMGGVNGQLTVEGVNLNVTQGSAFNGLVATINDADGNTSPAAYTATIDWGDSTATPGTVVASGTGFQVSASHTFATAGSFPISIAVHDSDGDSATGIATATVASTSTSGTLTAQGVNLIVTQASALNATVATFSDSNTTATAADFTASIQWGDGQTSAGTVESTAGVFQVVGQHTYVATGDVQLTVVIMENTGASVTAQGTVHIVSAVVLPGDANARFLAAAYIEVLGRPVDPAGLVFWDQLLNSGVSRIDVVNRIDHSAEYFASSVVTPNYGQLLGRTPDPAGLAFWVNAMQAGLSDHQFEADLLASQEFYLRAGGTPASFVDALYADVLGRGADPAGKAFWLAQLAQGTPRNVVAGDMTASTEHERQEIVDDFLKFLGRLPDAQTIGLFLNLFAEGAGNEGVVTSLVASEEFFASHAG